MCFIEGGYIQKTKLYVFCQYIFANIFLACIVLLSHLPLYLEEYKINKQITWALSEKKSQAVRMKWKLAVRRQSGQMTGLSTYKSLLINWLFLNRLHDKNFSFHY